MLSRLIMPLSETDLNQLRLKLMQAGYRQRGAQTVFLASKTIVGVVLGFAGVTLAAALGYDMRGVLGALAFLGGVGFLAPGLWLGFMIKGRQDKIRRGLSAGHSSRRRRKASTRFSGSLTACMRPTAPMTRCSPRR